MRTLLLTVLFGGILLDMIPASAAPKAELWEKWSAHDSASTATVDHHQWGRFLQQHIRLSEDGVNRVAYNQIGPGQFSVLRGYVQALQDYPISDYNRDEQFAFWVNLYNALTVLVVVEHMPLESIRDIDISPGLFAIGPWGKKLVKIEGEQLSLDDIEHRILRPIWRDPRVHYVVNCASIGCPNLLATAFTATNKEQLLEQGARDFINHPRGVKLSRSGELTVSSIYRWFREDFGGNESSVIAHLQQYADLQLAARLSGTKRITDYDYDWALNIAK